jgi:hypothetical protein
MARQVMKTYNKGEYLETKGEDMADLDNMMLEAIKHCGGTPAKYADDAQGLELFKQRTLDYFQHIADTNEGKSADRALIPSVEMWASFMGLTRKTLALYAKRGGEWGQVIEFYKGVIVTYKGELAAHYKIPPMIHIFDMTNNYGYYNTSEYKLTAEAITPEQKKRDDLEAEIRDSGLIWDSEKNEFVEE